MLLLVVSFYDSAWTILDDVLFQKASLVNSNRLLLNLDTTTAKPNTFNYISPKNLDN